MEFGIYKAYFILNEYDRTYNIDRKELEVIKALITFPGFFQIGLQYYQESSLGN